jgi:FAD/FMN-containing dehydrogenase
MNRKDFLKISVPATAALYLAPFAAWSNSGNSNNVTYYRKGDAMYESLRHGFNKRIDKFPAVIALCQNTQGVSEAVKYAIQNRWPIAVKSGGHCMEGFSCNNGGMVINLSAMNKLSWADNETLRTGPGSKFSDLYDFILPKGRIIPGGSCASVGIGGLTLGGGYGLTARKYGLTCDNLLEVTMVDGRGNIVSSAGNPELLWACRGGGNGNFGIITEMKFKTHQAPAAMQSFRFRTHNATPEKAKAILQKWFEVTPPLPPGCFSAFVLNGKTVYILLTNIDKDSAAVQNVVSTLSAISEKTTQTKPQPIAAALKVFYGSTVPMYFKNASVGLYKSFADIEGCIDGVMASVMATPGMIYQVNTLGGNIINAAAQAGSAFPHRDCIYFSELQSYWQKPAQGEKFLKKFYEIQSTFIQNGITAQYRNYPDINLDDWKHLYYGGNYERLQKVKEMYDPKNFIQHEQSIRM